MGLGEQLEGDLRQALRAGDALRVSTIRLARAAIKNAEIEKQRPLTDEEIQDILLSEVKRRREAIEAFQRGGRDDLSRKESLEMAILTAYLPAPLSEEDLRRVIAEEEKGGARFRLRQASFRGKGLKPSAQSATWRELRELTYEGRGG